jgi:hypothetical protein
VRLFASARTRTAWRMRTRRSRITVGDGLKPSLTAEGLLHFSICKELGLQSSTKLYFNTTVQFSSTNLQCSTVCPLISERVMLNRNKHQEEHKFKCI